MTLSQNPGPAPHWVCSDPESGDQLTIVPERGGLVTGWRSGGRDILYFDAARFADPSRSVRGGIPVLFPICGNLPDDLLELPQGSFPLPQHGFARDLPWALSPLEEGVGVHLVLQDGPVSRVHYPFAFTLELEVRLEPAALAIRAAITNRGDSGSPDLPFSLGLHPYVSVSDPAQVRIEGLPQHCFDHLTMAKAATADQLGRLAQGVDFLCTAQGPVRLVDPKGGSALTLETKAPMDLVVVWSEPPRPMVCLEPWTGPRGALRSGDRRLTVAAGERMELACRYTVAKL